MQQYHTSQQNLHHSQHRTLKINVLSRNSCTSAALSTNNHWFCQGFPTFHQFATPQYNPLHRTLLETAVRSTAVATVTNPPTHRDQNNKT
jgi:hypothetical protein